MKILTVYNDYLMAGGEHQSVQQINEGIQRMGVETSLFLADNKKLASLPPHRQASMLLGNLELENQLEEQILSFRPDAIHVENTFPLLAAPVYRNLKRFGLPWSQTIRNYRLTCVAGTQFRNGGFCAECSGPFGALPALVHRCYRGSALATAGGLISQQHLKNLPKVRLPSSTVFTSQHLKSFFEANGRNMSDVRVIPNPVKIPEQLPHKGWDSKRWDFVFVGRLEKEKGIDFFLSLSRELPMARFAISGIGSMASDVAFAAQQQKNLTYLGGQDQGNLGDFLSDSKFCLIPSIWAEPFGRVAIEAAVQGCIPICSPNGGLPEITRDLWGEELCIENMSIQEWAHHLRRISTKRSSELAEMSLKIQTKAAANFSIEHVAGSYVEMFRQVAQGG